jgi:hypothetical protein
MADQHAKLDTTYTLRIPSGTKDMLDRLTDEQKAHLNNEIRLTMAKCLHDAAFDSSVYLCDKE